MTIWFILWLLLAGSLIAFLVWTLLILLRQKTGWKLYATKRDLRYKPNALMESPEMEGVIEDYTVSLFSREHISEDVRGVRKLTAIEVKLHSIMPIEGGLANGGMVDIIKEQSFKQEYVPKFDRWKKEYIAAGGNRNVLATYLNDERLEALCDLMKIKHAWVIFIFKGDAMLLRVDTPMPLDGAKKVDTLVKQMITTAKILELKKGEGETLKSAEIQSAAQNVTLDVDDKTLEDAPAFELEDHEEEGEAEEEEPSKEKE